MSTDPSPTSPTSPSSASPELPKAYRPAEHENRIRERWTAARAFSADPQRVLSGQGKPYSILIPPPNVTARLHLGHALNNTLQDILTRAHRMMGEETLWMPGTDHAGIATQAVVERRLWEEEKKRRSDFTREEFIARVQAWKDDYEKQITDQLKLMGCSCDFDRQRFTMDPICAEAVREAFFRLFKDGLIYRGKRLVNWDPALQTAVADDECFEEDIDTSFWYLRYPLVHGGTALQSGVSPVTWDELASRGYAGASDHPGDQHAWVTVATTRPETYLADTAVAVSPHDPRAKALRGLCVELPLVGRVIPIVEDNYVVLPEAMARTEDEKNDPKAKFATGFLKVTPGHDKNDYELGLRHKLDIINMMSPDGKVSDKHGWTDVGSAHLFVGLTMAEARKKVVAEFKSHALLEAIKPYKQSQTFSDRSKAQVEPYLSDQWYVRVTDPRMAASANAALVPDQRSSGGAAVGGTALQSGVAAARTTPSISINHLQLDTLPLASFTGRDPYPKGQRNPRDFAKWIRNLPHIELPDATYFVTWTIREGTLSDSERAAVLESMRHGDGEAFTLYAANVMPDHVHAIIKPLTSVGVGDWVGSVKKFTARRINASRGVEGSLWLDERFDHIIRDEADLAEYVWYTVNNPVQAGLAASPSQYPHTYVSAEVLHAAEKRSQKTAVKHASANTALESGATTSASTPGGAAFGGTALQSSDPSGDGSMRFYPARYAKTFEHWHENIRDWCISRQLWWGHRIPVWTVASPTLRGHDGISKHYEQLERWQQKGRIAIQKLEPGASGLATTKTLTQTENPTEHDEVRRGRSQRVGICVRSESDQEVIQSLEAAGYKQDPDVLDTWFSSALWPLSTMGWPRPDAHAETRGLLAAYNPTSTLCTAREIITLWVSRMTMFNRYFRDEETKRRRDEVEGRDAASSSAHSVSSSLRLSSTSPVPFRDVYIHAVVQDGEGQKMSKSLGNGVDPLDIIETHGSDAMRFTLCQMATQTQDVRLPVDILDPHTGESFTAKMVQHGAARVAAPVQEYKGKKMVSSFGLASGQAKPTADMPAAKNTSGKFDLGRNFANKLWNASRFTMAILDKARDEETKRPRDEVESKDAAAFSPHSATSPLRHSATSLPDAWILSRLAATTRELTSALKNYEFAHYANTLYRFIWDDFCDWYLEAIKPTVAESPRQQAVLATALRGALALAHPVMPFITEAIWEQLGSRFASLPAVTEVTFLAPPASRDASLLCSGHWPQGAGAENPEVEARFERLKGLITAVREVRAQHTVPHKRKITLHIPAAHAKDWTAQELLIGALAGVETFAATPPAEGAPAVKFAFDGHEYAVSNHAEAVDVDTERARLTKLAAELEKSVATLAGRLNNPGYAAKAPPHMVKQTQDQLTKAQSDLEAAKTSLAALG